MDTVHSLGGPQCVKRGGTEAAEERNTWNQVTQAPCHTSGFALFKTSGAVAPGSAPAESRGSESRGIKVLIPLSERALGINYGYADLYYYYIQEKP